MWKLNCGHLRQEQFAYGEVLYGALEPCKGRAGWQVKIDIICGVHNNIIYPINWIGTYYLRSAIEWSVHTRYCPYIVKCARILEMA